MSLTYKDEVDTDLLARVLQELLPKENSPVVYDFKCHGGQRIKDQCYVLGPWAGPQADVSNVLHEICHFAEREVEILLKFPQSSWGFSYGKFWQIGTSWGYEPSTDQQVRREQAVWAYQLAVQHHFGMDTDPEDLVASADYLPAWCFYQPFAEKTYDKKIKLEKLAKDTLIMSKNEYNFEAFLENWKFRIQTLQDFKKNESC